MPDRPSPSALAAAEEWLRNNVLAPDADLVVPLAVLLEEYAGPYVEALSDAVTALERARDDLTIDARNTYRHQRGDGLQTVELSVDGLANAARDADDAAKRALSALAPGASHADE